MYFERAPSKSPASQRRAGRVTNARYPALVVAIVTLLAMLTSGFGSALWFCPSMGRVLSHCCCPPPAESASAGEAQRPTAKVERPSCCMRLQPGAPVPAAATPRASVFANTDLALAPPVLSLVAAAEHDACLVLEPLAAKDRPPRGPPLFLAHCALLI